MKKSVYIYIMLLAALAACSKNEVNTELVPLDFDSYILRPAQGSGSGNGWIPTKAGDSFVDSGQTHLPDGSSFGVFGFFHPQVGNNAGSWADSNPNHPNIMNNQKVDVSEADGVYTCTYSPRRYWSRNSKETISFFAYYPYDAGETGYTIKSDLTKDSNGMGTLRFRCSEDYTKQVDFMVSDLCMNQSKPGSVLTGSDKVQFTFHHQLAQVRINTIKVTSENPLITPDESTFECAFYGLPVAGNCVPTPGVPAANGLAACTFSWTSISSSIEELIGGSVVARDSKMEVPQYTTGSSNFLLVIPHTVSETERLEVSFDLDRSTTGNEGYSYTGNSLFAYLKSKISAFEANKIYTFNITVGLNEIKFDAVVTNWTEGSGEILLGD